MTDDFEAQANAARAAIGKPPVGKYDVCKNESSVGLAFAMALFSDGTSTHVMRSRDYWLSVAATGWLS